MPNHYDYIYHTCVFSGTPQRGYNTSSAHIRFLNNYQYLSNKSVLFVISLRGYDPTLRDTIKELCTTTLEPRHNWLVLENNNWGMLVGSMWDVWQHLKSQGITADYSINLEDDWLYRFWAEREMLLDNGYDYVGMFSLCKLLDPAYIQYAKQGYKNSLTLTHAIRSHLPILNIKNPLSYWTDGGLYFLKFTTLARIETAIGIFTKAPKDKFDYNDDGITYGEVGFPTLLWYHGFRFRALTDYLTIKDDQTFDTSILSLTSSGYHIPESFYYDSSLKDHYKGQIIG